MIDKFKTLLRVKTLREERLFSELQVKRQQVADANEALARAEEVVRESEMTLPEREEAIYREVYGKVIDLLEVDDVKGRVVDLEKAHERLKDKRERAVHVRDRLVDELQVIKDDYQKAIRERDKYTIITDGLIQEAVALAEHQEEMEIEDLFAKGKPKPA